jgi:hypothetical protein
MVFGAPESNGNGSPETIIRATASFHLPFSCRLAMILAAVPVLVLGVYIPKPLDDLLTQAAAALTK